MAVVALWWWPLSAWLSPAAAWFIFFNAVVGAIAVMSCGAHRADGGALTRRRLCRSGSSIVMDRLRSFSIFSVHPVAGGVTGTPIDDDGTIAAASGSHFYSYGTREAEEAAAVLVLAPEQPDRGSQAVAATTSGTATSSAAPPSAPLAMAPAEEDHAGPVPAPEDEEDKAATEADAEEQGESISLDEAYALAQRLRAQELASPPSRPPASATAATTATCTARTEKPATVAEGISRRRAKAEDALEGKAELNARAELFIRQFREELKLQRLNSIRSHTHALGAPTTAAR
ncbi:hypothetical protein BAE44_0012779 [Dichanthelium oligosanthes]|uniref:DUF4408 domain-containing protein n=1 Tax=Dichanthelium oligosanthes TaxID=888268 RepID=A0A1E5VMA0_9POAL|nr:hypothetical protein BAE44_0012779 [Dichanthelium oligosanthes]